jgi:predicted ABC-type ATPase
MLPEFERIITAGDPSAASVVHEESSALAKEVMEEAYRRGFSVVLDSTGSGDSFAGKKLAEAIGKGYDTQVSMISIPTNQAIERSVLRALNPESDSYGRFVAVRPLKDAHIGASRQLKVWSDLESLPRWRVYDNTDTAKLVAEGGGGKPAKIYDQKKWEDILAKGDEPKQIDEHMRPIYNSQGPIDYYPIEEGGHPRGWGLGPQYTLPEDQLVGRPGGVKQRKKG